jgi:hypothetical protein
MTDIAAPLTLAEQLDAMLHGWLERSAELRARPDRPGARVTAVLGSTALAGLRDLCARWNVTVETRGAIALVSGPARVVEGSSRSPVWPGAEQRAARPTAVSPRAVRAGSANFGWVGRW